MYSIITVHSVAPVMILMIVPGTFYLGCATSARCWERVVKARILGVGRSQKLVILEGGLGFRD